MDLTNVRTNVRKTLEAKGLSQEAFAVKHGLSYSWLNKFLCGKHDPRNQSLEDLQKALDAEVLEIPRQ
jgi:transcriptional regulator with XRE-family HTH domain